MALIAFGTHIFDADESAMKWIKLAQQKDGCEKLDPKSGLHIIENRKGEKECDRKNASITCIRRVEANQHQPHKKCCENNSNQIKRERERKS